jgi:flagellar FliL protein
MRSTGLSGFALLLVFTLITIPAVFAQEEGEETVVVSSSYVDLKPAFVVNYGGVGRLRYLKADIALRVGNGDKGSSSVRQHMPYIRHALVMLMSRASEEDLSSMEGRELLRQNALEAVREVLLKEEGEHAVEDLLFNSFIVQR